MADDGLLCGDAADAKLKTAAEKSMCFSLGQYKGPTVGTADCSGCIMASKCTALDARGRWRLSDGQWQLVSTHTLTFTAQTTDDVSSTLGGQADSLVASFLTSLVEASTAAGVEVRAVTSQQSTLTVNSQRSTLLILLLTEMRSTLLTVGCWLLTVDCKHASKPLTPRCVHWCIRLATVVYTGSMCAVVYT
jgi:hypothetical protein